MTDEVKDETPGQGVDRTPADEAVSEIERERDELQDRLLRTAAEFDNYRKRTDRERRELVEAASANLIEDLLPVVDDLERALEAPAEEASAAAYRRGVELIHRQLVDVLRRRGVERLEVMGQDFDPAWHEALASEPVGDHRDGEITAEIRPGYRIGSRLLRPAGVKVAAS